MSIYFSFNLSLFFSNFFTKQIFLKIYYELISSSIIHGSKNPFKQGLLKSKKDLSDNF